MQYCGFITILGRSNVGKSTLLNQLLKKKISITSHKSQTTQQCIMGIRTEGPYQAIYVDTPGFQYKEKKQINYLIKYKVNHAIDNRDLVIFVIDSTHWMPEDEIIIKKLISSQCLVILVINKVDIILNKEYLLPYIQFLKKKMHFQHIIPICAKKGLNVDVLSNIVHNMLPVSVHHFPSYCITNRSKRFIASEIIREKLIRLLGDELPYSIIVEIKYLHSKHGDDYNIYGLIVVKRKGQKKIVIGKKGSKIKTIGILSRYDMEVFFKRKINLKLWVKVKLGQTNNIYKFNETEY